MGASLPRPRRRGGAARSGGLQRTARPTSPLTVPTGLDCRPGPAARIRCRRSPRRRRQQVLVDLAVLHDDQEVPGRVFDQVDVLQRIAVDQQQVGERAFLDDAELARIGVALPREREQFALSPVAIASTSAGVYQRAIVARSAPWRCASAWENRMSVPHAVLILYFLASVIGRVGAGHTSSNLLRSSEPGGKAWPISSGKGWVLSQMPFSAISLRRRLVHEMAVLDALDAGGDRPLDRRGRVGVRRRRRFPSWRRPRRRRAAPRR